jgi:hypothetical protein
MVTDQQVRKLMSLIPREKSLARAAAKAGMDEKTARKYRRLGKLPSELKPIRTYRTREDPFTGVWGEMREKLESHPGLEAKTLFDDLTRRYPGRFREGQLSTLQRRIKRWRAMEGPPKEVYFPQVHRPGELCASDVTSMNRLEVTIVREPFDHLFYHFTLPYSNWETGRVCVSESFESISEGFQAALWELGGVPKAHRTDRMSTAVKNTRNPAEFTARYEALLRHYRLEGQKTNPASPHENGDAEERHRRFKSAVDQALMLRGNRDFDSRTEYEGFLRKVLAQLNRLRRDRFEEELRVLRALPARQLDAVKRLRVRVRPSSTIAVERNVYSVNSRLIGEMVEARLHSEVVDVWYGGCRAHQIPRVRGRGKHRINYRHIIDWLVRKPGAFENYIYREELFPTSRFRMAYDALRRHRPRRAVREYLSILKLAAHENETAVDEVLGILIRRGEAIEVEKIKLHVSGQTHPEGLLEIRIASMDLTLYDTLLEAVVER